MDLLKIIKKEEFVLTKYIENSIGYGLTKGEYLRYSYHDNTFQWYEIKITNLEVLYKKEIYIAEHILILEELYNGCKSEKDIEEKIQN